MTNIDPVSGGDSRGSSMNDNLASSNPSLRTVLIVLGCVILAALAIHYRSSFGF
jgi:hypothetical protein